MESNYTEEIINRKKTKTDNFKFFLDFSNENSNAQSYIHDFLGNPKLLQIGKYANDSYDFANTTGLIVLPLATKDGSQYTNRDFKINLPKDLTTILTDLQIDSSKPLNTNEFTATENIIFYWVIVNNSLDKKNDRAVFNIVPHTFLFPEIDFSKQKRVVKNTPICLVPAGGDKNIVNFEDKKGAKFPTDIQFNKLRVEYTSMHLIKGCLGFSPNNLKFVIKRGDDIYQFYIIVLDEYKKTNFVFYYWFWDRDDISISDILENSENINDILGNVENLLGKNKCVETVKELFK
jgi:hypothetical protein